MSVNPCSKSDKAGFRWGDGGLCFTGSEGKARAAAVGRAIHARDAGKADDFTDLEIETMVAKSDIETVYAALDALEQFADDRYVCYEIEKQVQVSKADREQQKVWAEVYVPNALDSHGDFMSAPEIEKLAHKFMEDGLLRAVDRNHDNDTSPGMVIIESFIARKGDPDFIEGSWVVGVHVPDPRIWQAIKDGEFNGFSMQAKVYVREAELEIDIPPEVHGTTDFAENDDGSGLHTHGFRVRFDSNGKFLGGETTFDAGHMHEIKTRTTTQPTKGIVGGHKHRYSFLDEIL